MRKRPSEKRIRGELAPVSRRLDRLCMFGFGVEETGLHLTPERE